MTKEYEEALKRIDTTAQNAIENSKDLPWAADYLREKLQNIQKDIFKLLNSR